MLKTFSVALYPFVALSRGLGDGSS